MSEISLISGSRLGNEIVRSIAGSIIAEKHNLSFKYHNNEKIIKKIGIPLFSGTNIYENTKLVNNDNYLTVLNSANIDYNVSMKSYCQTKQITDEIHKYLNSEKNINHFISNNKYKDKYQNNNDCFIHIRLGDVKKWNQGFKYYGYVLSKLKCDNIYIATDENNNDLIKEIQNKYDNVTILGSDFVDIFQLASTCRYVILSYGTFSAIVGYTAFYSTVYCLKFCKKIAWDWNEKNTETFDMFRNKTTKIGKWIDIDMSSHFDIVIPIGPNDISICEEQIKYTKKNIIGYRNIYLVCSDPSININDCIIIDENIFPFNIETVIKYHGKNKKNGWYLQQLLKLYSGKIIPNILDKYLVIDCDTFFLKPTTFIEDNKCLYNFGDEHFKPYFEHMLKLDNELVKVNGYNSGICHHMIFETKYIDEIISKIEKNHNDVFYDVFLKLCAHGNVKQCSGASEYEIYYNYMLKNHRTKIKIRKLEWKNLSVINPNVNLDYISVHYWIRK